MNLHEYQSKNLFAEYGLPVSKGVVCDSAQEAVEAAQQIGGNRWVVKCQVHAGGRGKAGGVKLVSDTKEIEEFATHWLGNSLTTLQTDEKGQPVNRILIEEPSDIDRELYLGAVIDRSSGRITFMASTEGGVEIETVAEKTPELIHKVTIDPVVGPLPYQGRKLAFKLNMKGKQIQQFAKIFVGLGKMFNDFDLSLLEINPLVITKSGDLLCLDAKVNIDSNALFRQQNLQAMRDPSQENPQELHASQWNLSYVKLDGSIGCMVNGAGLAMGTMDLIKLHGGEPANFLDVGGSATSERVAEGFKIILEDKNVNAILVNIFGGIVQCDLIARGIIHAVEEAHIEVPVIVRLEGNNAGKGIDTLEKSKLKIITAESLTDAAKKAVKASKEGA